MPAQKSPRITKQQKEAMADALAAFFFDFWQNNVSPRDTQAATLETGSSRRGGSPTPKVAT
jgi:hypothetical protein